MVLDTVKRKIVKSFGDPELAMKIYDSLGKAANEEALIRHIEKRGLNKYTFAGVGHIYSLPRLGPCGDIQLYGISNRENPDDIYPFSITLRNGQDLHEGMGRACMEETILFGKEAELFLKLEFEEWKKIFAI